MAWTLQLYLSLSCQVICILHFIRFHFDVLLSPLSKSCHKSLSLQGNKEYREICQRSIASTLRSTVAMVDRYSSAVDRRNGRLMLLSGRPSPTEDEWWPDVWGSEVVRNAKEDRGKASKRQGRSWHGFPTPGEIVAPLPLLVPWCSKRTVFIPHSPL